MRGVGLIAEIVGLILIVIGCAAGFLLWTLSGGPINSPFVTRQIAEGIESRLPEGYRVALSTAEISEVVGGLHLHVEGLVVRDETGKPVIVAPTAEIGFDGLSLLIGRLVPRDIDLTGLLIAVTISPSGSVSITEDTNETTAEPQASPPSPDTLASDKNAPLVLGAFIDALSSKSGALSILQKASLHNGILRIDDQRRGRSVRYRNLSLRFDRQSDELINLDLHADSDHGPWQANATLAGRHGHARELVVKTDNLHVSELLGFADPGSIPLKTEMPLSLSLSVGVNGKSELTSLKGSITGGRATVILDDPKAPPLNVDGVTGAFALSDDGQRILFPLIEFVSQQTHWRISGDVRMPQSADEGWSFLMRSDSATMMVDTNNRPPVSIDRFALSGSITPGFKAFLIDQLTLEGPELYMTGSMLLGDADGRNGLRVNLDAKESNAQNLLSFWPGFLVPDVRSYLGQAIEGGTITEAHYALDLSAEELQDAIKSQPIPQSSVALSLSFVNGTMRLDKGLPRFIQLNGQVDVTGKTVKVTIEKGKIELPEGRSLALQSGTYDVPNTDIVPPPADVVFRIAGAANDFATALQSEMIKSVSSPMLDPKQTSGSVEMDIALHYPQKPDLKPSEISVTSKGTFRNLHIDHAFGREPLDNGTVTVTLDPSGLVIAGEGLLGQAPSQFELKQKAAMPTQDATVTMIIDDALREKKQMRLKDVVTGPLALSLKITGIGGPKIRGQGDIDLQKASISGLVPGWNRPAGKPGKINFNFAVLNDQSIKLDGLSLDDNSISFKGNAEISPDGDLKAVTLTNLRIAQGDRLSASYERSTQGIRVKVQGDMLDGRALIKSFTGPGKSTPSSGQDFELELKVATVTGFNSEVMRNVDMRVQTKGGLLKDLKLDGKVSQQAVFGQAAKNESGKPVFVIQTADAGALLRFTDIYKRMNSGALSLEISTTSDPSEGTLSIRRFAILEEAVLAQLNAQRGAPSGKPIITDPRNVQFARLAANYTLGSGSIAIKDGVISGPVIGASIEGTVDYSKNTLDLRGAIVPAYIVNNLLNNIPIIGQLLGGENEGIFSINYRAEGPISSPTFTYNPLSVVAPGFLRKLFEERSQSEDFKPPAPIPVAPK